ncbi:Holliday junction endonuclease [Acaryochloris sp. 'Moss Beach']|uniref:Holliday junction endonuclease n=1 Tax=Acaryochloris sp. 'Moss Beach' TaxID=2740837 RepID=UPI001F1BE169|nr:Holliday junction endonuclease [Acaryochloris sp. 'Moss Beach']UJB69182.1 Holliday junction endonuclease [Acaryochloris sp. 'Moss Beach']
MRSHPQYEEQPTLIALDPGLKGGIAISGSSPTARPLPLAGKELDLVTLASWIEEAAPRLAVIEKVGAMPKQGVASTFKFGLGYGGLLGVCAALKVPVELVTPQRWKRTVLAGTSKDKAAAIAYCRRAFPGIGLIQPGCRKPHDGMADALCLMAFGVRELQK